MTDRLTADTINDGALDSLYDQLDRLRAGEEDGYDPLTVPTPGQWIWVWNRATPEERHRIVAAFLDDAATASLCRFEGHKQRLGEDRKAWVPLGRVRALADRWGSALAPDITYARALRAALNEPAPGPAATEDDDTELTADEARDLADELGIDLYRAQDALAFVGECCAIADREKRAVTTADVREWLKGARCGRQLAADAQAATQATKPGHVITIEGDPATAHEAIRQMDTDTTNPHTGLVVQPYRDHGEQKWVFRCWGTDTCDGWLSLDHHSEQSAQRARDRHVTEEHGAPESTATGATKPVQQTDADPDDPPVQCWHTEANTPCDWDVCKQPERLAAGDYGTDPREQH